MARPLRIEYAGAFYHITSRGNERRKIFSKDRDRQKLLSLLSTASVRYGLSFHAYCLMGNHYHLLLETSEPNLSRAIQFINGRYTSYYNLKYSRAGHLFQGRYKSILVERDSYASVLSRYIHLNPLRAGICMKPEGYRWSSYRGYMNPEEKPSWLDTSLILGYFRSGEDKSILKYKQFVEDGIIEDRSDPLENVVSGCILGTSQFVDWVSHSKLGDSIKERDLPSLDKLKRRVSLEEIKAVVIGYMGEDDRWTRDICLLLSHRHTGSTLNEIGNFYSGLSISAVSQAIRRLSQRAKKDNRLKEELFNIELKLKKLSTV